MANVTVTKDRYTVDSLYQWSKDQDLIITGLSLASIPEIHFTNDAMDKAIVKQATMNDAGVITARIPNSLLQKPYKIRAYVCIYEGDSFRSLYLITIPIEARSMPNDYTLTVSDDEVYSFNSLENLVNNTVRTLTLDNLNLREEVTKKCDDTVKSVKESNQTLETNLNKKYEDTKKAIEESNGQFQETLNQKYDTTVEELNAKYDESVENAEKAIEETTNELSARVDNIIAHNNDTNGNTELVDIRTGIDGSIYETAGKAVRENERKTKDVRDRFETGKNKVDESLMTHHYVNQQNGKLYENATHIATDYMEVEPNEDYIMSAYYYFTNSFDDNARDLAFRICQYDCNKNFISGTVDIASVRTASNAKYVRVSCACESTHIQFEKGTVRSDYEKHWCKLNPKYVDAYTTEQVDERFNQFLKETNAGEYCENMGIDSPMSLNVPNIKKNNIITFHANITDFHNITVGQGKTGFGRSAYITVDDSNIYVYRYTTEPILVYTLPHGLNIDNYIDIILESNNDDVSYGKITVISNGAVYSYDNAYWKGCDNTVFAEISEGTLTNCTLSYYCADYKKDLWIFGDSYLDHWVDYAMASGFKNYLCDGYTGRSSVSALESFKLLLSKGTPKKVFWALGMNDGDYSAQVNDNWKAVITEFLTICEDNNITPILCTIPNVPTVRNQFKNEIVRNSGYRYIDLAKAVGADSSTTWYEGLLHEDNVHPSQVGDEMVAYYIVSQIPEMLGN